MVQANAEQLVGTTINERYEIQELIAEGTRASIYRCLHTAVNMRVALKVQTKELHSNDIQEFQQEGKTLASLAGTALISRLIEFGLMPSGQPFLLQEYLEGATLAQLLEVDGKVGDEWFKVLVTEGLDALQFVHDRSYIHADLKPSKFMFMNPRFIEARIKLLGFGRARKIDKNTGLTIPSEQEAEEADLCPLYSSPEVMDGEQASQRSDIYSFGCVLYQALTGSPPFYGETALETLLMHKHSQPIAPSQIAKKQQLARYDEIVLKCLQKKPADRYGTVPELKKALAAALPTLAEKKAASGIGGFLKQMLGKRTS